MDEQFRWSSDSEAAEMDGEWVVMNVTRFTMTKFADVGGFIWSKLQVPRTKEELVLDLLTEYEASRDQVELDVTAFLHQLTDLGLVELVA